MAETKARKDYMAGTSPVNSDSKLYGRTTPLKIICPSMPRSGTGSMQRALEILGMGRTYHGFRSGERAGDLEKWIALTEKKFPKSSSRDQMRSIAVEDFDELIGDCGAVTDMPCTAFWRELLDAYPDAKIIILDRDPEEWHRSFVQTISSMLSFKGQILANHYFASYSGYRGFEMLSRLYLAYFKARSKKELIQKARDGYVSHNEAVVRACQQQGRSLLHYKIGSGWEPLCKFLKLPLPATAFPHVNEGNVLRAFHVRIQNEILLRAAMKFLKQATTVGILLLMVWFSWRQ